MQSLHAEDYYKTQGLAFIMLVAALIHQEVEKATRKIDGKSLDAYHAGTKTAEEIIAFIQSDNQKDE